jgi:cytochrome c5
VRAPAIALAEGLVVRPAWVRAPRCSKLAYPSKKVAKQRAAAESRATGERIEAYHCYRCHAYHIGHPPGSR